MTPARFKELCASVRRTWTPRGGAVAILATEHRGKTLRLVAGCRRNQGLVAERCVLWDGDDVLYDGPLESEDLKRVLSARHMVWARVTTAARLDSPPRRADWTDLRPERRPADAERPAVQGP